MFSVKVYNSQETKELTLTSKDPSVAGLFCAVSKLYGHLENPREHLRLVFIDKDLEYSRKRKISSYGICNNSTVAVVLLLPNGHTATQTINRLTAKRVSTKTKAVTETRKKQRELQSKDTANERTQSENFAEESKESNRPPLERVPGKIEITDEEDFIGNRPSAKMPCDHLISSEAMRMHCETQVNLASGKVRISCAECSVEWDYRLIRNVACFTVEEMHSLEKTILLNFLGKDEDVFTCPGCYTWVSSSDEDKTCLRCFSCSEETGNEFLFCRYCFSEWKNPVGKVCSNPKCSHYTEAILDIVRNSPMFPPYPPEEWWSILDLINPDWELNLIQRQFLQFRMCPRCGLITEFMGGCNQVHCDNCRYYYCFICLDGASRIKDLKCRSYAFDCILAPCQTRIPQWKGRLIGNKKTETDNS